jgi:hypothetical protein
VFGPAVENPRALTCVLLHPPMSVEPAEEAELARLEEIVSNQPSRTKAEMIASIAEGRARRQQPTTDNLR